MRLPLKLRLDAVPYVRLAVLLLLIAVPAACSSGGGTSATGPTATAAATGAGVTLAETAAAPVAAFPFTVTGTDGSAVKLAKPAERIVSLSPGATETLFAIGAGAAVVAADRFSDFPAATKSLPKVEYTRPSVESLAAFRPDLIIAAGRQKDTVAAIQAAGLPVVLLEEPATVQGVIDKVGLLGRVTGRTVEADKLVESMQARIRAVTARLAGVDHGPRVFHEVSNELFTAAPSSFIGDLYTMLKARNIAEGATGAFPQLSQEVVVQRDPEVIVLANGREGVTVEQVRARPGWGTIAAVRTGRVYLLTDEQADTVSRPGPRLVDALETLAKLLYPERF